MMRLRSPLNLTSRLAMETRAMQERRRNISSKNVVEGKGRLHAEITSSKGRDILNDPVFNKGLAFRGTERDRMGLRGLLPPVIRTMNEQERIVMDELCHSWSERKDDMIQNDEMVLKSGIMKEDVRKKEVLMGLHERNETLYYKIIMDYFNEMSKIIYTPSVGWACARYSGLYKKPRGMFFSLKDKGEFASMVFNWDSDKVDVVVVTDGSRVLGLGDLGIGGLGISIGKLDLYIAAGGFHPRRVLPVVIDIGTDNPKLRNDPNYMGLINPRIDGWEYYEIIDEFMEAVALRWPKALIQFEDFQTKHAIKLLQRYKRSFLMFNDDIQVRFQVNVYRFKFCLYY
jgi:malate dehydrogenase (decarboxylating)